MTTPTRANLAALEAAMDRALAALDRAERLGQSAQLLDRFEAQYFAALAAYERAHRPRGHLGLVATRGDGVA